MKTFTDHFSSFRKTIALCLLATFAMTNVVGVRVLAANADETSATVT